MLMVTHQCNLHCTYCYEKNKSSKEMTFAKAKELVLKAFEEVAAEGRFREIELSFMGGEPLLRFQLIKEIAEWMWGTEWKVPYVLFLSTNGTLLNDEMKQWFSAYSDKIVMGLSFDGDEEMQNLNRTNSASMIDIDFFVRTWPDQAVKTTVSRETLPRLAEGVIKLHERGFSEVHPNLAYGVEWQGEDYGEYMRQLGKLVDYYLTHTEVKPCSLLDLDLMTALSFTPHSTKYCGCGDGTACLDVDGTVYPCQMFAPLSCDAPVPDIDFRNPENFVIGKCRMCVLSNVCHRCYGMNYMQYGSVNTQPDWLCRMFKIQFLMNCEMRKRILDKNPDITYANEYHSLFELVTKLFNQNFLST